MKSPERQSNSSFEKKSKFLVTTLILSALGHIPLMVPEPVKKGRRLAEDTADYIEVQARNISRYKYRDPKGEIDFRRKLASDLEQGKDVNYEKAYFTSERLGQGMTLDELQEALDAVDAMIEKLSNNKPEIPTQEFLRSMVAYCGGSKAYHKTKSSVLGFLASGGADDKGNCEARAKLMVIAMERLYPDRLKDTNFQYYEGHVRTLIKIQETKLTYALEGEVPLVMPEDVLDTAIESPRAMLERYAKGRSQTLDVPTSGSKLKDTGEGGITDTIFTPPKTDKPLRAYATDNPFAAAEGRAAPAPMDLHPLEVDLIKDWTPEEARAKRQAAENNPGGPVAEAPNTISAEGLISPSAETIRELNDWHGKKPMDQIWYGNVNAFSLEAMREALLSPAENMTIAVSRNVPEVLLEAAKPQYVNGKQRPARTRQLTLGFATFDQEEPSTDQIVEFVVASAGIPEIGIVAYSDEFSAEQARAIAASDHKTLHVGCDHCSEDTMRALVGGKPTIMTGRYYQLLQKYPWLILEKNFKPEPTIDIHTARVSISNLTSILSFPGLQTDQRILNALYKEEKRLLAIEAKDDKAEKERRKNTPDFGALTISLMAVENYDLNDLTKMNSDGMVHTFTEFVQMALRNPEILAMENIQPTEASWQKTLDELTQEADSLAAACAGGSANCNKPLADKLDKYLKIFCSRVIKTRAKTPDDTGGMPASTIGDYMPKGKRE